MHVMYPVPIALYALATLLVLAFAGRVAGLKAILVASYCGVYIVTFTGGATGAIWLAEVLLVIVGVATIGRRRLPAFGSRKVTILTYAVMAIYLLGILVGAARFSPTLVSAKAGSFQTFLGIPLSALMAGYRLMVLACVYFAFTIPLRYRIDRSVLVQCLTLCWIFSVGLAVAGLLDYFGLANLGFTLSREIGAEHESLLGFQRGTHGMMMYSGIMLTFAMTQATRSNVLRLLAYATAPVLIVALLLTWSRSATIAMAAGAISLAVTQGGLRAIKGILVTVLGVIIIHFALLQFPDVQERYTSWLTDSIEAGSAGRIENWTALITWLFQKPDMLVTGAGFQNFNYHVTIKVGAVGLTGAHNSYLHILTECGIFGLLAFVLWIGSVFAWVFGWWRRTSDPSMRSLSGTLASFMVGIAVGAITLESLVPSRTFVPICLFTYLILGIWISYYRTEMSDAQQYAASNATLHARQMIH